MDMQARMSTHVFMRPFDMRDKSGGGKRRTGEELIEFKVLNESSFSVHSENIFRKVEGWSILYLALVTLSI